MNRRTALPFTKMQGLGNDFVVLDGISQPISLNAQQAGAIADRHFGVGCDQILLAEPTDHPEADCRYRIWNADGGEVEHCGNGVRCLARFLRDQGLIQKDRITVETHSGLTHVELIDEDAVRVNMGPPQLAPEAIPFTAPAEATQYSIAVAGETLQIGAASMGNPHAVLRVDDVETAPVGTLGPLLEAHARFPQHANAGFLEVVSRQQARLRVFERGAGETLACGTGACAAVVIGRLNDWFDATVTIDLRGGSLVIHWEGVGEPVWMTGPAVTVFEGQLFMGIE